MKHCFFIAELTDSSYRTLFTHIIVHLPCSLENSCEVFLKQKYPRLSFTFIPKKRVLSILRESFPEVILVNFSYSVFTNRIYYR